MKRFFIALACSLIVHFVSAQPVTDSSGPCAVQISLLTCTPGTELYSTFGHSALRVTDNSTYTDSIYNYGTFDFEDPAFLYKFTRGKLLYFVSTETFKSFAAQYYAEGRGVTEQVLDLSCDEKRKLLAALHENAKEENKYYTYDFVYDNCTTRLRDIIFSKTEGAVATGDIRPVKNVTFRHLIHEYLDKGGELWSKLGIDILLGSPLDKKISNSETMFLPDYLLKGFDSTRAGNKPLVQEKKIILQPWGDARKAPLFTPALVFSLLFFVIAVLSFIKGTQRFLYYFDVLLFFVSGLLGLLLLFMWFGTDHQTCRNNLNLAWAFPGHVVIAFFLASRRKWLPGYFLFTAVLLFLLLAAWKWLPQDLNNALVPVAGLLLLRNIMRYKSIRNGN